jgi:hypothetical protein
LFKFLKVAPSISILSDPLHLPFNKEERIGLTLRRTRAANP